MQNLLKIYKKKYGAGNEETTLLNLRTLFVAQILKICTAAGGRGGGDQAAAAIKMLLIMLCL